MSELRGVQIQVGGIYRTMMLNKIVCIYVYIDT